jgi:hypothetical protein
MERLPLRWRAHHPVQVPARRRPLLGLNKEGNLKSRKRRRRRGSGRWAHHPVQMSGRSGPLLGFNREKDVECRDDRDRYGRRTTPGLYRISPARTLRPVLLIIIDYPYLSDMGRHRSELFDVDLQRYREHRPQPMVDVKRKARACLHRHTL